MIEAAVGRRSATPPPRNQSYAFAADEASVFSAEIGAISVASARPFGARR
jgi:hypothetical protein